MDAVQSVIGLIEFVITAVLVLIVLVGVLAIIVSLLPRDNPLRHLLFALLKRLALMAGLGVFSVPLDVLPPIEVLFDLASVVAVIWYWLTFLGEVGGILSRSSKGAEARGSQGASASLLPAPRTDASEPTPVSKAPIARS